jgi:hypothetical protein
MKTTRVILGIFLLMLLAGGNSLVAQNKTSPSQEIYPYESGKQVVISGVVQEVRDYKCPVTGTVGAHITVATATSTIEVHLAPVSFLKQYEIVINKGDKVEIQGARILFENKPALLAKMLAIDKTTYAFRDPAGKPLW